MYQEGSIDGSLIRNLYALASKYTPLGSYYNDAI